MWESKGLWSGSSGYLTFFAFWRAAVLILRAMAEAFFLRVFGVTAALVLRDAVDAFLLRFCCDAFQIREYFAVVFEGITLFFSLGIASVSGEWLRVFGTALM